MSRSQQMSVAFVGRCSVCGHRTVFLYDNRGSYRESLVCANCRTTSRYRSIARGVLRAIKEISGVQAGSISELEQMQGESVRIYDTQASFYSDASCYPIPDLLSKCMWIDLQTSIYDPGKPLGVSISRNITNQNLEELTFPDNRFDIVITSDVMEHVRLDDKAHHEIARVLKTNGVYIFTVPHFRHAKQSKVRVGITDPDDPSRDNYLMEPEYHGDPNADKGSLCYRVYGTDLDDTLESLGFVVEYVKEDFAELGIISTELFYCQLVK